MHILFSNTCHLLCPVVFKAGSNYLENQTWLKGRYDGVWSLSLLYFVDSAILLRSTQVLLFSAALII